MAELNAATRNRLPARAFGLPKKRKYPEMKLVNGKLVPDREHAQNAKARATQMVKRGRLSSEQAAKIRAKANRILKK